MLTPESYGIEKEQLYTGESLIPCSKSSGSWNKKVFHGKVKIGSSARLYFGDRGWYGFYLWGAAEGALTYGVYDGNGAITSAGEITPSEVGATYTSLTETWLDLAVSIEVLSADTTSGSIRVGIFIDEELCEGGFITISGINSGVFTNPSW